MRRLIILSVLLLLVTTPLVAGQGIVSVKSMYNVQETAGRLESILQSKGMTVIARINHSMAAQNAGMTLRPTELLIFGNPKVGTPLMQCQQSVALDLPQKALIWEDDLGSVWISYNDPEYLVDRHNLEGCDEVIAKVKIALSNFAHAAAGK
jgi:uncharacterized protein (DUF302 family)